MLLLTPKPMPFSMLLFLWDTLKACHPCPISSSMKSKFIHNRKAKTPTWCHYFIHLTWAKAPKFQAALTLMAPGPKIHGKIPLIFCGLGKHFIPAMSRHLSSKYQCASHPTGRWPSHLWEWPSSLLSFQETHTHPGPCRQSSQISPCPQGSPQLAGWGAGTVCGHGPDYRSLASVSFPVPTT